MKKIPTVYERNWETYKIDPTKVTPGCEWVLAGEGVPTRKYDGTCVMLDANGRWWARREVKHEKPAPWEFQPIETDIVTNKTIGWEPIETSPWWKHFRDAFERDESLWEEVVVLEGPASDVGTYELVGPKVNGNPEHLEHHFLKRHGYEWLGGGNTNAEPPIELIHHVAPFGWEGIVWHHPDGRRAKLKVKDLP